MIGMKYELDDKRPIYLQIKEMIEDSIIEGVMNQGERVPSTNELAKFYSINPATARQGMNELVQENILEIKRGVGMIVTENAKQILMNKRKITFYKQYVAPLKSEAEKLEISKEQLITMIEKGDENNSN